MMNEHTALPWTYQDDLEINGCYIILHKSGMVAEIVPYWGNYDNYTMNDAEAKANARLIVTACNNYTKLLEACRLTAAINIDKYDACDEPLHEAWNASVDAIRNAEELGD